MYERIIAVVAKEVEVVYKDGKPYHDFTFLGCVDQEDRIGRPWGVLLKVSPDHLFWNVDLYHPNGDDYKASGFWEIDDIISPHWLPECIILTEEASFEEVMRAARYWEVDIKTYRVDGAVKTARNPYPWRP